MVSLECVPEFAVTATGEGQRITLNVRVCAPELAAEDESKRACVSLSAVLDKSGSMAGQKLALVKRTCRFMLGQLGPQDKLGVIEYDSDVNELIPLSKTSQLFQHEAAHVIDSMREGSCTNLSGGLFKGVSQQQANTFIDWGDLASAGAKEDDAASWVMVDDASSVSSVSSLANHLDDANLDASARTASAVSSQTAKARSLKRPRHIPALGGGSNARQIFGGVAPPASNPVEEDAVRSVFLFTDGIANVGLCDEALVAATKKLLDSTTPIKVFTFGFGSDHSEQLLSELAAVGGGLYYYIEKEDQIAAAFADALGGLLSVAAQNVTLDFVPSEGVVIEQLHTPFKTIQTAAGGRQVTCGDLLSEENKDILVEATLPRITSDMGSDHLDFKIGSLKVSYFDVGSASLQSCQIDLTVKRATQVPEDMEPNLQVSLQRARVETVAALARASQLADANDFAGARAVLEQSLKKVTVLVTTAQHKGEQIVAGIAQVLVADLEEAINGACDVNVYRSRGSKAMCMKAACRSAQRCDFTTPGGTRTLGMDSEDEEDEEVTRFKGGSVRQRRGKASV